MNSTPIPSPLSHCFLLLPLGHSIPAARFVVALCSIGILYLEIPAWSSPSSPSSLETNSFQKSASSFLILEKRWFWKLFLTQLNIGSTSLVFPGQQQNLGCTKKGKGTWREWKTWRALFHREERLIASQCSSGSERQGLKYIHRIWGSRKSWVPFASTALYWWHDFCPHQTSQEIGALSSAGGPILFSLSSLSSALPTLMASVIVFALMIPAWRTPAHSSKHNTNTANSHAKHIHNVSTLTHPVWNQHLSKCAPSTPVFLISINDTTIYRIVQYRNFRVRLNSSLPLAPHIKLIIQPYQPYIQNTSKSTIFSTSIATTLS